MKTALNGIALCLVWPCALTCWLEHSLQPGAEGVFAFWTHVMALLPGTPGRFLRRAFYRLTLSSGNLTLDMGFGAFFAHRESRVEDGVYIGPFAVIGRARLGAGSLIGTRASVLSGSAQHTMQADGRWSPTTSAALRETSIGRHCWIGEGAMIMADVADGSLVSAGAVVSSAVPPGVVVAGNPARFVRMVSAEAPPPSPPPGAGERK